MCEEKHSIKFIIAEILFICLAIAITVFSFLIITNINKSEELKIKVNFETIANNKDLLFEKNANNIYEKFFEKYNLKEGDSLKSNEKLLSYFENIYKLNLAIIVAALFLSFLSILIFLIFLSLSTKPNPVVYTCFFICTQYFSIIKSVIIFILFGQFFILFIAYKIKFENDFFNFYYNINNNKEKVLFKKYYYSLFNLKNYLFINVISLPLCSFVDLCYFIICQCTFGKILRDKKDEDNLLDVEEDKENKE